MNRFNEKFTLGKLKHKYLAQLLSNLDIHDNRVIMGSKIGEDAAVIDIPGENYLVLKTDPVTFATVEIGYYAVIINVNDLVCTGAKPKWFQSTILLPDKLTSNELIENIFKSIHNTCKSMGITVVGGHTEITPGLDRPIVIGSLVGEVEKNNVVLTSGAKTGDALILTKGIFIEGTSIIGREKEKELMKRDFSHDFVEKCKNYLYNPGISVFKEALLANEHFKLKKTPFYVNTEYKDWEIEKPKHNTINILWSGSSTHYSDLVETGAADAIKSILKKDNDNQILKSRFRNQADFYSLFGMLVDLQKNNKLPPREALIGGLIKFLILVEDEDSRVFL